MTNELSVIPESPLARLDPRLKIVFVFLFSFVVALADSWTALCSSLAVALVAILLARLKLTDVLRRLVLAFGFLFFLWAIIPFTTSGEPFFHLGPLAVTWEGVLLVARISVKSSAILLMFLTLPGSSSIAAIGHALQNLGVPEKLVYLFFFCYRYIFVIEQEFRRLEKAARMRSFQPGTNLHTYRTFAYLIGMLFLRSSLRAEQVHRAMICRGFQGRFHTLETLAFRPQDRWWAVGMFLVLSLVIALEWLKHPL